EAGDPGCVRDYVHVGDVVSANLLVLDKALGGTFNVSTGVGRTTREVLDELARHVSAAARVTPADPRPGDLERSVLDPARVMKEGWKLRVSFEEGIRGTLESFRSG